MICVQKMESETKKIKAEVQERLKYNNDIFRLVLVTIFFKLAPVRRMKMLLDLEHHDCLIDRNPF